MEILKSPETLETLAAMKIVSMLPNFEDIDRLGLPYILKDIIQRCYF